MKFALLILALIGMQTFLTEAAPIDLDKLSRAIRGTVAKCKDEYQNCKLTERSCIEARIICVGNVWSQDR